MVLSRPTILCNQSQQTGSFLRLDLEDLPMPSFHRPDLVNFWYHRMLNSSWLSAAISKPDEASAEQFFDPYPNGQSGLI